MTYTIFMRNSRNLSTEKKANRPLVSICIPNYNGSRYLSESIKSALSQTYENIEVIVVDNCSTDGSWKIISSFKGVQSYRNKYNIGYVGNLNRCVEYARGKYIKILHADDILEKDAIEKQVKMLESGKSIGLVYGSVSIINDDGTKTGVVISSDTDVKIERIKKLDQLLRGNHIMFPSAMVRKECFGGTGIFDEELPFCCDWDMWMRICLKYDAACLKDIVANYRVHIESGSQKYEMKNLAALDQYKMFNKIFNLIKDEAILKRKKFYYFILAREQIAKSLHSTIGGNPTHARRHLIASVLIQNSPLFFFSFPLFYFLTFLGKYPSKLLLRIGKCIVK